MSDLPASSLGTNSGRSIRGSAARMAGAFLVVTALITAVSALTRVSAQADFQPSLQEFLDAVSLQAGLYGLGGAARLVSGVTLVIAAWLLMNTWIIRQRLGSPLVPVFFMISGVFTAVSGLCAAMLAVIAPDTNTFIEFIALVRWLSGKVGFALAGLALIVASRFQWKVGAPLRYIAPVSAILGAAMQFIWIDSATMIHPVVGTAFFLWLIAVGGMLVTGRTEKLFARMLDSKR